MSYMKLAKTRIQQLLDDYSDSAMENRVQKEIALSPECAGIRMYERPIVGISSATDHLYETYNDPSIIGEHYMQPDMWLKDAKSVISFFNPFTQHVKDSNAGGDYPSNEWMHGRIEGQAYVVAAAQHLAAYIRSKGYKAIVPIADGRYLVYTHPKIYSNWSERHAAYASGLGTFSRNRAIITEKGIAGRFCSVITDMTLDVDERHYTGIYDNCIMCGACQRSCPVEAINNHGKSHMPCKAFLDEVLAEHPPWYGCGKCQCGMPCESGIPRKVREVDYSSLLNINNGNL